MTDDKRVFCTLLSGHAVHTCSTWNTPIKIITVTLCNMYFQHRFGKILFSLYLNHHKGLLSSFQCSALFLSLFFPSGFISKNLRSLPNVHLSISVNMLRTALLLLAASLAVALARPRLKPLSSDMVNYINKMNTTWKVICIQIQHIHQKYTVY